MTSSLVDFLLSLMDKSLTIGEKKGSPFEITAEQFLDFAIEDLKNDSSHSRINALGNVKRAIESRIDQIFFSACLHVKSQKERWDFPKKIEILAELGVIAPKILRRINRQRNLLEHEYVIPKKDDVEDAIDVATLFIAYTDKLTRNSRMVGEIQYVDSNKVKSTIKFDRKKRTIIITDSSGEKKIKISHSDEWFTVAKILLEEFVPYYMAT